MSVYGGSKNVINEDVDISEEMMHDLIESFVFDELAQLTDEKKEEFLVSEECKVMQEAGTIGHNTLVRLNKTDDMSRRITLVAFNVAKQKDDPNWLMLVKNRIKERELIGKIVQRYKNTAERTAKVAQRSYLKIMPTAFTRRLR